MPQPYDLGISEIASQIRKRQLSPVVLIESLFKRIDSLESSLHAWVTVDRRRVLEEARRYEREVNSGKVRGPLHGVPIGVKDIYYTAGLKTAAGSKIFADFVPAYDAEAVGRLKEAGAVILGKTATTEFAFLDPAPTRNPWNPEHTPGGSSSGSAAAVAARMCPAALGTQTAGSVLRPAAFCGVVGFKPTYDRISRQGIFPLSWNLDHVGFFTRCVGDATILLAVLADNDPEHPLPKGPVKDSSPSLRGSRRPPHIGLVREFYQQNSEAQVWKNTDEVVRKLKSAGARIEDAKMPASFAEVQDTLPTIMRVEAASFHETLWAKHKKTYGPKLRELIETGLRIPGVDYLRAQKIKRLFRREMDGVFEHFDALLTPATSSPAPAGLSSTGNAWFQVPWTLAGLPAVSLPSGLSKEKLPLGVQLVGAGFADEKLLASAAWCEKNLRISLSPELP